MQIVKLLIIISLMLIVTSSSIDAEDLAQDSNNRVVATFSIVAHDSATGELGVGVASKFFAVGVVVPWAKAGVGAIATQAYANTSFGWRGLEMLKSGMRPEQVADSLIATDDGSAKRQFGIVAADGNSFTFTGKDCLDWAGGRSGQSYAIQGNILAGSVVVEAMEKAFLETEGSLADRIYSALLAGDANGGDSRGKQSAALLVVKEKAGYGGYDDRAIDIRVDDHKQPFVELGRLLKIAQTNYAWNEAWTAFTEKRYSDALPLMERTAELSPKYAEVIYDLAVIRLAAGDKEGALAALRKALELNQKLLIQVMVDNDLVSLREESEFQALINQFEMKD